MTKTLNSGITVDADQYYKLLDWKDKNMDEFCDWVDNNISPRKHRMVDYSINYYTEEQYKLLIKFAGI